MKNIRRIDGGNTHGYQFHCCRGGKGLTKLFSDSRYGGKRKAMAACKEYRDEQLAGKLLVSAGHRNSSRGLQIPGVQLCEEPMESGGYHVRIRSQVVFPKTGTKRKSWNVEMWGYDEALELAIKWRKRNLAKANRQRLQNQFSELQEKVRKHK